jgi:hypothetical protein
VRIIPVPDSAVAKYPEAVRKVMLPPDGDMFNEECGSADMLIRPTEFMGAHSHEFMAFFQMEPEDVDRLRENGGILELSMISNVIPFSLSPL